MGKLHTIYSLVFLIVFFFPSKIFSQDDKAWLNDSSVNSHVIIAFDAALPHAYRFVPNHDPQFNRQIRYALLNLGLHSGDYYSFVNFVMGSLNPDLNSFARTSTMSGHDIAWYAFSSYDEIFSHGLWNFCSLGLSRVQGKPFSILTGAKPYSLKALYKKNKSYYSNKTYLLMVTDDQYNGNNDINTEYDQLGSYMQGKKRTFLDFCRQTSSLYRFEYKKEFIINSFYIAPYKVIVFEVIPQSSFSLNSVVDYPATFGLRRTKAGYRLNFNYKCMDKDYTIQKLQISYKKRDGEVISKDFYNNIGEVDIIMNDIPSDSVKVRIRSWLKFNDGFYGGVVESPIDDNFERLSYKTVLPLGNNEKILGLIPLFDFFWWFYPNDLTKAVMVWDVIILIVISVLVFAIRIFDKWTKYEPGNNNIKITKI